MPRGQAFVERWRHRSRRCACDQPALDPTWHDRHQLEETSRFWRAARHTREHGVGDAGGDARRVAGEHFGDEEGIAAGDGIQTAGRTMGLLGQRGHGAFREREQAQPCDVAGGQIAQDETQGVVPAQFIVALGQDEQRWRAVDAACEVLDEIQRRLVGPVDVFDDQDGRRARE